MGRITSSVIPTICSRVHPSTLIPANTKAIATKACAKPFTSDEERLEYLFALYEQMTADEQTDLLAVPSAKKAAKGVRKLVTEESPVTAAAATNP